MHVHFNILKSFIDEKEEYKPSYWVKLRKAKQPKLGVIRFKNPKKTFGRYGGIANRSFTQKHYQQAKQLCILKAAYRRDKNLNKKHLDYIRREGTGIGGADPELYGADPQGYEKRMAKLHFRFIISPENQTVDLRSLTEEFVKRIELRYGLRLDWVAADHFNTGKKHTHLLVNGFDLNRKMVFFKREDIQSVLRETLRDICTEQVGYRTLAERQSAALRQTESNSFTMLDRQLEKMANYNGEIPLNNIIYRTDDCLLHRRIMYLQRLQLAKYDVSTGYFHLKNRWQDDLKTYGFYNTFLSAREELKAHPSRFFLHPKDSLETISGKVVKKYYMQDNSNNHAIVLETEPGVYKYVPLQEAPKCKLGGNIRMEFQQVYLPGGRPKREMTITPIADL